MLALLMAWVSTAYAVDPGEAVGPVQVVDSNGQPLAIENYADHRGTAFLFMSGRCPVTDKVIGEVNTLYQRYRRRGVLFAGVCSNRVESSADLTAYARNSGMIFTIYRDPSGRVAGQLGATLTPVVFLVGSDGNLAYHGGLGQENGIETFENAIKGLIANEPAPASSAPDVGTPIDKPGKKVAKPNPYGKISFSSEMVFEQLPDAACVHCSTLAQAPNGDLLCLWYGGSFESADDQVLFLARKKPGRHRWQTPEVLLANQDQPPGNGVIFVDGLKRVWIVWGRMESRRPMIRGSGWDRCRLMYRVSTDNGQSWSRDQPMIGDDEAVKDERLWMVPRNGPIQLAGGRFVLPLEAILDGVDGGVFLLSDDEGNSWRRGGFTPGGSQPTLAQRNNGTLVALMRKGPRITSSESADGGQTWSDATHTELRNPDAGISMTTLNNGHWVLVFNNTAFYRTPLSIVRSTDEGTTWETPLNLESNPGEYSYPSIIQSADGQIQISYTFRRYTIKHVEMNEDWLIHTERPN